MTTSATATPSPPTPDAAPARARNSRPHGKDPVGRERILEAAAQLFVQHGYAATTTRLISTTVGIKQPSLYYHFPNKASMLLELLLTTAKPSVLKARELQSEVQRSPLERLLDLMRFDVQLLASGPWNIGSLYLLPEVTGAEFEEFRTLRYELIAVYGELLSLAIDAGEAHVESASKTSALLFSIVEGVILRRADDPDLSADATAEGIEEATVRILAAQRDTPSAT